MKRQNNSAPDAQTQAHDPNGIVSVNSRGGTSGNLLGKVIFVISVIMVALIGALFSFNKWRDAKKADEAVAAQAAKLENKPAAVGPRRTFDADPPPVPAVQPHANAQVPGVQSSGAKAPSRYAGDVLVTEPEAPAGGNLLPVSTNSNAPMALTQQPLGQVASADLLNVQSKQPAGASTGSGGQGGQQQKAGPSSESLGTMLTPSTMPMVEASMMNDRNMVLPKGRTIDCGLSMRLVSEMAGMASCVLSQNVYSDNGRVLLLERGSEATGEYVAAMTQGQRRLFVLWTRIKTPNGVVINLNSPAADGLGTAGMGGYVDNHWWERIGGAFLLSLVQDAIAYKTAKEAGGNGTQSVALFQNSTETGSNLAEKVLENTINIKPTLYKNQGDRGSIYVARDLYFGSVYAVRAR